MNFSVDYYEAVAQAILSAKSEIYIEDWWLVSDTHPILLHSVTNLPFESFRVHNWYFLRINKVEDFVDVNYTF